MHAIAGILDDGLEQRSSSSSTSSAFSTPSSPLPYPPSLLPAQLLRTAAQAEALLCRLLTPPSPLVLVTTADFLSRLTSSV